MSLNEKGRKQETDRLGMRKKDKKMRERE